MNAIFQKSFERTLDQLSACAVPGDSLEAWTFDDRDSRAAAERKLAEHGITARIRSAYKPLLSFFLEEVDLKGVEAIEIRYPVHAAASENRFRLETYPLAALVGEAKITFVPRTDDGFFYDVMLTGVGTAPQRSATPDIVHATANTPSSGPHRPR